MLHMVSTEPDLALNESESHSELNAETLKALKEAEEMERTNFANVRVFDSVEEFMAYLHDDTTN